MHHSSPLAPSQVIIGEGGARTQENAPVLILDEPTSALDPESELLVREAIAQLRSAGPQGTGSGSPVSDSGLPVSGGRIVLVVAHRLNTVLSADQVAVLEDGRLVEAGRHRELLDRGGAYARLLRADTRVGALA